jgi:Fic family protein
LGGEKRLVRLEVRQELSRLFGLIFARAAKRPGEIKGDGNRAGNTLFVAPELVVGTLMKGFELMVAAPTPAARAALAMFVVAEVHPFGDGNGRTARLAMNLALSEAGGSPGRARSRADVDRTLSAPTGDCQ